MAYGNGGGQAMVGGFNGMDGGAVSARQPLIANEIDRQVKCIEHLHGLLGDLEGRISAITRPDSPVPVAGENKAMVAPATVPLASTLESMNARIDGACHRLQSLLNRIEL